jgi:hypothetical protein
LFHFELNPTLLARPVEIKNNTPAVCCFLLPHVCELF